MRKHGLDFKDVAKVLIGRHDTFTALDTRRDYGEDRYITIGRLNDRCVVIVHTETDSIFRVISMRHAERDEEEAYYQALKNL